MNTHTPLTKHDITDHLELRFNLKIATSFVLTLTPNSYYTLDQIESLCSEWLTCQDEESHRALIESAAEHQVTSTMSYRQK